MPDLERLSHQLRTPLTTIRLVLELAIRKGDSMPPEALEEMLVSAVEQTHKLESAIREAEREATGSLMHEEDNVIVLHEESTEPIRVTGPKAPNWRQRES